MLFMRLAAWLSCIGIMVVSADIASGQAFPSKPIRIVTAQAGGGLDFAARLIAQGLTGSLGQQLITINQGGAGGMAAAQMVAKAAPDGYTLLFYNSNIWLMPFLRDNVPYDPLRDFSPITLAVTSPNILVVHPSLPIKSVMGLIALAQRRPGELNYAANEPGSSPHLAGELFKAMAGANIVAVPYKGGGPALTALLGGQVQLMFATPASVAPHIKSGRVRALAVTSAEPSALLPGLPAIAASGVPGYSSVATYVMFAPAGTAAPLISRLNQEIALVLNRADIKEKFSNVGVEIVGNSPDEVAASIRADMARMGKVIKDRGIRAN